MMIPPPPRSVIQKDNNFVFSFNNVKKAWQTLPKKSGVVLSTHLYVKFTPTNEKIFIYAGSRNYFNKLLSLNQPEKNCSK